MKKLLIALLAVVAVVLAGCSKFDDTALWQAINKNTSDIGKNATAIAELKVRCDQLNADVSTLKTLVESLDKRDYIVSCTELADKSGYTIEFASKKSIVIRHGKNGVDGADGKDGRTPQVGVKKHTDGCYYWTLDGAWMKDADGNMIKAEGKDGADGKDAQTPQFKIEDGYWFVSVDAGTTWSKVGKATGADGKDGKDGVFTAVSVGADSVTLTLADGSQITLPLKPASVAVTGEYSDLTHQSVSLYGWCNKQEEEDEPVEYGIEYSATDLTTAAITVKATSKDSNNKFCCLLTMLSNDTKYYYRAYVLFYGVRSYGEVKSFTTKPIPTPEPEPVDLGLSVKWASFNLGASKPEEYGKYFAWGDVTGQTWNGSSWSGGGFSTYPKYELDSNGNLKPEYDAAHVKLGSSWRMPTKAECQELIDNCTSEWTSVNGVNGRLFTSKKNGNSLFLPAAGNGRGSDLDYAGTYGYYWSSTFFNDNGAWRLYFDLISVSTNDYGRFLGQSVRPVSE